MVEGRGHVLSMAIRCNCCRLACTVIFINWLSDTSEMKIKTVYKNKDMANGSSRRNQNSIGELDGTFLGSILSFLSLCHTVFGLPLESKIQILHMTDMIFFIDEMNIFLFVW